MNSITELWRKHRPTKFDEVVGQDPAVNLLKNYLSSNTIPHAILFTGNSGCGKSTLAAILANEMGCIGIDRVEINCASIEKPLDTIREIERAMKTSPFGHSKCRIWILEEFQAFARAGYAQQAMLRMLEDDSTGARLSYFFLCTSDPSKIRAEIKNRCKKIELNILTNEDLTTLLKNIIKKENREVSDLVIDRIIEASGGVPREAVNQLDSVLVSGYNEEDMLKVISSSEGNDPANKLIQLFFWKKTNWKEIAKLLKEEKIGEHEKFRHRVMAVANTEMLKAGENTWKAYTIADIFSKPFYDNPSCGLALACYEVYDIFGKKT